MELAIALAGFMATSAATILKINNHLDKRFDFLERRMEILSTSVEGNQRLVDHRLEVLEDQRFTVNGKGR